MMSLTEVQCDLRRNRKLQLLYDNSTQIGSRMSVDCITGNV